MVSVNKERRDNRPDVTASVSADAPAKPAQASTLPKPSTKKFQPKHADEFFQFLRAIPTGEWPHLLLYGYRTWPVINREPKNIQRWAEPITQEKLLMEFGGGRYKLTLTDNNRSKFGEVCSALVHMDDDWQSYPPVLNEKELDLAHRDNQGYITWLKTRGQFKVAPAEGSNDQVVALLREVVTEKLRAPKNDAEAIALTKAMDMLSTASAKSIDIASSQNDPTKMLALFTGLKSAMGGGDSSGAMMTAIFGMLSDAQKTNTALMLKLLDQKSAAVDPLAQMTTMLGLLSQMRELIGAGGGGDKPWYADLLDKIPETLREGAGLLQALQAMPGASTTGAPSAGATVIDTHATPAGNPPAATAGAPPVNAQVIAQLGPSLISALNRGKSGYEFAAGIEATAGITMYSMIANLGKDALLGHLKSVPQVWAQLQPMEPQLIRFIEEFVDWDSGEPGGPDDEPGELDESAARRPGPVAVA